jgi:phospholipid transport system substrate-binding protein
MARRKSSARPLRITQAEPKTLSRTAVNPRRSFLTLVACCFTLAVAPAAFALSPAAAFVQTEQGKLTQLIKEGKPNAQIDQAFDKVLDYRVLAEASLGSYWAERTDAERDEFTKLLTTLVRNSYRRNLKKTLDYSVAVLGSEPGNGGELVHTKATSSGAKADTLDLDYLVRETAGGRRIVDVVTDGSSMVANYRSSFGRIIKKGGFADVLKRMRKKAAGGADSAD